MSFNLGSLNPLSTLSDAVKSACDSILPKELSFVGDIAALSVDYQTGNFAGGVTHLADLTNDLPQQQSSIAAQHKRADSSRHDDVPAPSTEPVPPPGYAPNRVGFEPPEIPGVPSLANTPHAAVAAPVLRGAPPAAEAAPTSESATAATTLPLSDSAPAANSAQTAASGETATPAGAATADGRQNASSAQLTSASEPAKSTDSAPTSTTGSADASKTSTTSGPDDPAKKSADQADADKFFNMSNKDIMDAVRNGTIPDAVSKDPDQMRRLQLRITEAAEMNQLITTMLATIHDMNKSVIQNLRA